MASLRQLRAEKFLTVRALAAKAKVATQSIVSIEARAVLPQFGTMQRIAAALDVEPIEIDEFRAAIEAKGKGLAA
ncbi:MAG TPA: helix-turn-helix transcriptional regulator [Thermomicrobiales bacterium]|jgi:DNA-binding XRE family transcriptional regulator